MNASIFELDKEKCNAFLLDRFGGWLYFISKIVDQSCNERGKFFCFASSDSTIEEVYDFNTAKSSQIFPDPEDVIINYVVKYLSSGSNHCLIAEDGMFDATSPFFVSSKRHYYLVNDIIFYALEKGAKEENIRKVFSYFGGYGFFPFLTSLDFEKITQGQNIDDEIAEEILNNVSVFFTPIYDDTSYLIWINNGHIEFLEQVKRQLRGV
ncbi:MAG: hypothetical protein JSS82_13540 [Bacteroidetes bacterium]|nr:hypothetical protein [Bacteroidota bacterium]